MDNTEATLFFKEAVETWPIRPDGNLTFHNTSATHITLYVRG